MVKLRWALVLFYVATYLVPLGFRPMVVPDEFRYAEIPREMLATGEWNNPQLLHVPYYEKPAFGYQLTMFSFELFGLNRFALRLPAALGAGIGAFMLYWLFRRRREELTGIVSAAFYLTAGLIFGIGTFAVLDSQLTGAITVAIAAFYLATQSERRRGTAGWLLLCGAAAGAALLIKGLLGVAIPGMVIGGWLLWQREWRKILLYPWLPLAALLAVVLPWAWAQHQAQPGFWEYFIKVEHLDRFLKGTGDSKPEPFWYFIPVFLGGIFPAALWLPQAFSGWAGSWKREFLRQPFWRLTVCWWAIPFLFFSCSSAKLGTYILPCCAPFALWLGYGVMKKLTQKNALQSWTLRLLGIILVIAAPLFTLFQILADAGVWHGIYTPQEKFWIPVVVIALVWGILLARGYRAGNARKLGVFFAGLTALVIVGTAAVPEELIGSKMPEKALAAFRDAGWLENADAIVVTRSTMHAVPWCWGKSDVWVWGSTGEITGFKYTDEYDHRQFAPGKAGIRELRERIPRGRGVIITRGKEGENPFPPELEPLELGYKSEIWMAKF